MIEGSLTQSIAFAGGAALLTPVLLRVAHRLPLFLETCWEAESKGEDEPLPLPFFLARHPVENIPPSVLVFFTLVFSVSAGITAFLSPSVPVAMGLSAFALVLGTLAIIDAKTCLLPDAITLPLPWVGLLFCAATGFVPLTSSLIGAVAGYLSLWLIYWAFRLATGKEGMGYGDFKLFAGIGAFLGYSSLSFVIILAATSALLMNAGVMLNKLKRGTPIPFGPYLAMGAVIQTWLQVSGIRLI